MNRVLMIILAILILATGSNSTDITAEQAQALETDKLIEHVPDQAKEYLEGISPSSSINFIETFKKIIVSVIHDSGSSWRNAVKTSSIIIAIVLMSSLISGFIQGKLQWIVSFVGVLSIATVCIGDLQTMIGLGQRTVDELSVFANMLLPTLAGTGIAAGSPIASNAIYAGTVLFLNLFISFFNRFLVPLMNCYTALSIADSIMEQRIYGDLKMLILKIQKKSLQIVMFVFSGYISLTGIVNGHADAITIKSAKMAISSFVPVVGGMLSDASETVILSAKMLRSSVGIFGLLAVGAIAIIPLLKIAIHYFVLQITQFISGALGEKKLIGFIDALSSAMGHMFAIVGCCGLMIFISCMCFMRVAAF